MQPLSGLDGIYDADPGRSECRLQNVAGGSPGPGVPNGLNCDHPHAGALTFAHATEPIRRGLDWGARLLSPTLSSKGGEGEKPTTTGSHLAESEVLMRSHPRADVGAPLGFANAGQSGGGFSKSDAFTQ